MGFLEGDPNAHRSSVDRTVLKNEDIANQSITGLVSSKPGTHSITFDLVGTVTDTHKTQPIRDEIRVVVK